MPFSVATSIRQLIFIGFFLVVLPLIVVLISAFYQVDTLSRQMQKILSETSSTTESSRIIVSQVLNLERTAGQFWVLREATLLQRYQDQRQQLMSSIKNFRANPLSTGILDRIEKLTDAEHQLFGKLQSASKQPEGVPDIKKLTNLSASVSDLPFDVSSSVTEKSAAMSVRVDKVERFLLFQALVLISLALVIAGLFSIFITRPLHQLGSIINKLGRADFIGQISVKGPEDIQQLGHKLDWLRQQLAELDQQKKTFLQHVSHELKTPLTALCEGISLLQDRVAGPLTADQTEIVDVLQKNNLQLKKEVEALLDFNFSLSLDKPVFSELVSLDQLLQETVEKHQLEIRSRSIAVEQDLAKVSIKGDRIQLGTVMDNLLSNAIKYSPKKSSIRISIKAIENEAQLEIIDCGPGIDHQDEQRIFEPFYQGHHLQQGSVSGTGLGLAIVKRHVSLHHGSIQVIRSLNGAHFRVNFPRQEQDVGIIQ